MRSLTPLAILISFSAASYGALVPKAFKSLPLGQVMPSGWLHDQLMVQTNGLAGHEHDFYNYVAQTDWTGGSSFYSTLEEAGSYWFNGMVPNGVLVNSATIKNQTTAFYNYVLDHQGTDGWLGPEAGNTKPRYLWGRYPFFFGAQQMSENDPTLNTRLIPALMNFVNLSHTMLQSGKGIEDWTKTRWADYVMTLQWLYEDHTALNDTTTQNLLVDTMKLIRQNGNDWMSVFLPQNFPKVPTEQAGQNKFGVLTWHGVNVAEGLKAGAAAYRWTGNQSDLAASVTGWDLVFQYHGRPSGIYAADEYLAGLEAVRGTELCLVVETMFTGSYLYQVTGLPKFPDRVERITYNALPATLTGDMWSRQYLQQQNQIAAQNMSPNPFPNDGSYSNVFGLEPNYPCCTVNHPQGWPKFVSNAFVTTPDGNSLAQVYLGPFSTTTTLSGGSNKVTVSVDTQYPFSDTLTTTVNAQKAFTYYTRIPSWVQGGTMVVNNGASQSVAPNANGLQAIQLPAGTSTIKFNLPAPITLESRPHGSVAVQRGPLHYAFDIPRSQTVLKQNAQQPLAKDLQFEATASWQYAIDPATLKFTPETFSSLPSPVFDSNLPPVSITVTACPINWPTSGSLVATSPPTNATCTGAQKTITLTPYGSTKLRIGEFPVFKST